MLNILLVGLAFAACDPGTYPAELPLYQASLMLTEQERAALLAASTTQEHFDSLQAIVHGVSSPGDMRRMIQVSLRVWGLL
jgi:hypothetical protein